MLTHFGTFGHIWTHFVHILTHFDILKYFDRFWNILKKSRNRQMDRHTMYWGHHLQGTFWHILIDFDIFGQIWAQFDKFWEEKNPEMDRWPDRLTYHIMRPQPPGHSLTDFDRYFDRFWHILKGSNASPSFNPWKVHCSKSLPSVICHEMFVVQSRPSKFTYTA